MKTKLLYPQPTETGLDMLTKNNLGPWEYRKFRRVKYCSLIVKDSKIFAAASDHFVLALGKNDKERDKYF